VLYFALVDRERSVRVKTAHHQAVTVGDTVLHTERVNVQNASLALLYIE
jgi:hypothetical protein